MKTFFEDLHWSLLIPIGFVFFMVFGAIAFGPEAKEPPTIEYASGFCVQHLTGKRIEFAERRWDRNDWSDDTGWFSVERRILYIGRTYHTDVVCEFTTFDKVIKE